MSPHRIPTLPWSWAWGCLLLAFPWSNAFMSVATGFLGLTALTRWKGWRQPKPNTTEGRALRMAGAALILLVAWSGISFLWGGDGPATWHDVRVKLPLAVGGLAMWVMGHEHDREYGAAWTFVLKMAVLSALAAGVSIILLDLMNGGLTGGRQSSRFISHIRFGLWWALLLPWVCFRLNGWWIGITLTGALLSWSWTQGLTGVLMAVALAPWWFTALRHRWRNGGSDAEGARWPDSLEIRRSALGLCALLTPILVAVSWSLLLSFPDANQLDTHSEKGEAYVHNLERRVMENGHHVWVEVAWGELSHAWAERSAVPVEEIQGSLMRFLASKGWAKDGKSVAALSDEEVRAVERRIPSVVELEGPPWSKRWNRFKYNWGEWWDGYRSPEASILARSVYLEAGLTALSNMPPVYWLVGSGSGEDFRRMEEAYVRDFPDWPAAGRKRPHNQFFTLFLALGAIGLILLIRVLVSMWRYRPSRPGVFLLAASFLAEDTLETQAGVTLAIVALAWGTFNPERSAG